MKYKTLTATAVAATLILGAAIAGQSYAHGLGDDDDDRRGGRYGMMGHMGGAMMGGKHGYGMKGLGFAGRGDSACGQKAAFAPDVTVDSVTKFLEQRLSHMNNDRLKVGEVTATDDKTITAEIVTQDDSLVQKLQFDTTTGRHSPIK